jgi:cytochrome bd-type quinol oxidase subunit 1
MALGVIEGRRVEAMGSIMGLLAMSHSLGMVIIDLWSFSMVFIIGTLILLTGSFIFFATHKASPEQVPVEI